LLQKRIGLRGISDESTAADAAITWPFSLPPCGHNVDKNKGPIDSSGDLEMKRTINAALDNDYINSHWAEPLDVVPISHGKLIRVHNACVKGGDKGLVVPHLGGLFKAFGYMDRKYFPESSHPIAFREFTFQELLGLFGTTAEREKHNVKHVNATLVRSLSASSLYYKACVAIQRHVDPYRCQAALIL
jgi:hypothetical protein